ncbi:hypothetical protein [Stackebrandtia soli]|uniref:hypothetical protein n=1 Tax=Stackebrandtia soli TaxID=1892856 RepID=UPI0039EA603B
MITLQAVVKIRSCEDFDLWPIAKLATSHLLPLNGTMDQDHLGAAITSIAATNCPRDDAEQADDPRAAFLDGLFTTECLITPGGLLVVDTVSNTTFAPSCCHWLDEWRDWLLAIDEGPVWLGHEPSSKVERHGETMRLTVNLEHDDPVIELPVDELRRLLAQAERDLGDFLMLARSWATSHLPERVSDFTIAMAKALNVAPPTMA